MFGGDFDIDSDEEDTPTSPEHDLGSVSELATPIAAPSPFFANHVYNSAIKPTSPTCDLDLPDSGAAPYDEDEEDEVEDGELTHHSATDSYATPVKKRDSSGMDEDEDEDGITKSFHSDAHEEDNRRGHSPKRGHGRHSRLQSFAVDVLQKIERRHNPRQAAAKHGLLLPSQNMDYDDASGSSYINTSNLSSQSDPPIGQGRSVSVCVPPPRVGWTRDGRLAIADSGQRGFHIVHVLPVVARSGGAGHSVGAEGEGGEQEREGEGEGLAADRPLEILMGSSTCTQSPDPEVAPQWRLPLFDLAMHSDEAYARFVGMLHSLEAAFDRADADSAAAAGGGGGAGTSESAPWCMARAVGLVTAVCGQEKRVSNALNDYHYGRGGGGGGEESPEFDSTVQADGENMTDSILPIYEIREDDDDGGGGRGGHWQARSQFKSPPLWQRRRQFISLWLKKLAVAKEKASERIKASLNDVSSGGGGGSSGGGGGDDYDYDYDDGGITERAAAKIFDHLCVHNFALAVQEAQSAGLWRLATIIAQLDGCVEVPDSMRAQLRLWYNCGYEKTIPKQLQYVYRLLAGDFVYSAEDGGDRYESILTDRRRLQPQPPYVRLGWERCLGPVFWYGGGGGSLGELCGLPETNPKDMGKMAAALKIYRAALDMDSTAVLNRNRAPALEGEMSSPAASGPRFVDSPSMDMDQDQDEYQYGASGAQQGLFSLLELLLTEDNNHTETEATVQQYRRALSSEGFSRDPLDHRASFFVLVLLECIGMVEVEDSWSSIVRLHFVDQLIREGKWRWAVFIALHMGDGSDGGALRTQVVKSLLHRCGGESSDSDMLFLSQRLRIPQSWIHESLSFKRAHSHNAEGRAEQLIKAVQSCPVGAARSKQRLASAALDALCTHVLPMGLLQAGGSGGGGLSRLFARKLCSELPLAETLESLDVARRGDCNDDDYNDDYNANGRGRGNGDVWSKHARSPAHNRGAMDCEEKSHCTGDMTDAFPRLLCRAAATFRLAGASSGGIDGCTYAEKLSLLKDACQVSLAAPTQAPSTFDARFLPLMHKVRLDVAGAALDSLRRSLSGATKESSEVAKVTDLLNVLQEINSHSDSHSDSAQRYRSPGVSASAQIALLRSQTLLSLRRVYAGGDDASVSDMNDDE